MSTSRRGPEPEQVFLTILDFYLCMSLLFIAVVGSCASDSGSF